MKPSPHSTPPRKAEATVRTVTDSVRFAVFARRMKPHDTCKRTTPVRNTSIKVTAVRVMTFSTFDPEGSLPLRGSMSTASAPPARRARSAAARSSLGCPVSSTLVKSSSAASASSAPRCLRANSFLWVFAIILFSSTTIRLYAISSSSLCAQRRLLQSQLQTAYDNTLHRCLPLREARHECHIRPLAHFQS